MSDQQPKFLLGEVVATQNAHNSIPYEQMLAAIARHVRGDWGELEHDDIQTNERALMLNGRLVSVYRTTGGIRFYVITEWHRSRTTVLLPEDY